MSAQEIIAELSNLSGPELKEVDAKLHELLRAPSGSSQKPWGEALSELAGTAAGLPSDLAHNHDHYLHGSPKR